jgi:hypothetical protein
MIHLDDASVIIEGDRARLNALFIQVSGRLAATPERRSKRAGIAKLSIGCCSTALSASSRKIIS